MEEKTTVYSRIEHLLADEPSDWLADRKQAVNDAAWLKYSQLVALKVLRRLREMHLSQNELADKIGVSRQQVNKWLKGRENFTFETVAKLGEAVEMSLSELVQPFSGKDVSVAPKKVIEPYPVPKASETGTYLPVGGERRERAVISIVPDNVKYY